MIGAFVFVFRLGDILIDSFKISINSRDISLNSLKVSINSEKISLNFTYVFWTFLRFEIKFAVAVAMGAAAGAGGIGFDMFMANNFYLDIREI